MPRTTRAASTKISSEEGKKDSFSIPGENKVIPGVSKSTAVITATKAAESKATAEITPKKARKENKLIAGRTEQRKTFVKQMSKTFGGSMSDRQCAAAMGTCIQTVRRYKGLIKNEEASRYENK